MQRRSTENGSRFQSLLRIIREYLRIIHNDVFIKSLITSYASEILTFCSRNYILC
jgi:hypothetical protein